MSPIGVETQEFFQGAAIDVPVAGVVVQAGMGSRSVGGQLVVQVMEGYGRIGLHLAAENAREAVGEVDAVFHYVGVGGFATAGRTEQQHTRKALAIRADGAAVVPPHPIPPPRHQNVPGLFVF